MTDSYDAIVCTALEGPDALQLQRLTRPPLRPDEARLRVLASGVNFPDLLMTRGACQFRPDPPFTPGLEVAGKVIEVGSDATIAVGARVCASVSLGGYASEVTVAGAALKAWPAGFSAAQAASFYVTAATAWHGLVDRGGAKAGERPLVLGAGGGVGLAAVQIGRALGLEVAAAARNPDRRRAASEAGPPNSSSSTRGFAKASKPASASAPSTSFSIRSAAHLAAEAAGCLAWGGRYLIVGFASGTIPTLTFNRLLLAGYGVLGVRAGEHARRHPDEASRSITALLQTSATYDLRPRIGLEAPLCRAGEALRALEAGEVCGKAVLLAA